MVKDFSNDEWDMVYGKNCVHTCYPSGTKLLKANVVKMLTSNPKMYNKTASWQSSQTRDVCSKNEAKMKPES